MLGDGDNPAGVLNVTAIHNFEESPSEKCAIAYEVNSPRENLGIVYLIVVYSIAAK